MNQVKAGKLVLAGVGLVSHLGNIGYAESSSIDADSVDARATTNVGQATANPQDQLQERLVVEGGWIKVPPRCKDRSMSSNPHLIESEPLSPTMAAIHAVLLGN